jgi:uncharacterized protein YjbJ (UPF0337 family)
VRNADGVPLAALPRGGRIRARSNADENSDQMKGKLKQLSGEIKWKWGQITDDDVMQAEGSLDKVVGRIQERLGKERKAIEKWFKSRGV